MTGRGVYEELYGGGAPPPAAAGASRRIDHPRGASTTQPYQLGFTARSLHVENPSGVWYVVEGFTVAPWTWGQIVRVIVPSASIAIVQATPTGLTSENYGDDLLVIAYEDALLPSVGRSLHPPPHNLARVAVAELATQAPTVYALGVAAPSSRVVPMLLQFASWGGYVGSQIVLTWQHEVTPGGAVATFARQVISPESPQAPPVDASWLTSIGANCDISVNLLVEPNLGGGTGGGGAATVAGDLMFYRALP